MWIESDQKLRGHPKVRRAARTLGVHPAQVLGHLHCLWWWALDHALDGDVSAFDALDLAEAADWDGDADAFLKALLDCGPGETSGFLERRGDRLYLDDWAPRTEHLRRRREASAVAHHTRWHERRGIVEPGCDLCPSEDANAVRSHDGRTADALPAQCTEPDLTEPDLTGPTTSDVPSDPEVSEEARALTRRFALAVKANGHPIPSAGTSAHATWLAEMDRLLRLGPPGGAPSPADPDEVARVIDWATSDDFEAANVQAVPKLRKRYSALRLKALRTNGSAPARPAAPEDYRSDVLGPVTTLEEAHG